MSEFSDAMGTTKEEWENQMEEFRKLCKCIECPSFLSEANEVLNYPENTQTFDEIAKEFGNLFCKDGICERHSFTAIACLCKKCPTRLQMKLQNEKFCVNGTESYQRGVMDSKDVLKDWWYS